MLNLLLVASLLALAAQDASIAAAAGRPSPAEEIIVTAERTSKFRGTIKTRPKTDEPYCVVRRSSGLSALDGRLCEAMVECHQRIAALDTVRALERKRSQRKALERLWLSESRACMTRYLETGAWRL